MADINQSNQYLSDPTLDVKKKWLQVNIQEKKSQMNRAKQDIDDLKLGKIVQLEAFIIMLEKDIEQLNIKYLNIGNKDVMDI